MIREIVLKKNSVNGAFVDSLADFFYKDESKDGRSFKANIKTGLNYFGEYLERHEDRDVSLFEVLAAVCKENTKINLPEHEIFEGQYEMFVERVEERRAASFDFELEIFYIMFLMKMKKEDYGKRLLRELLAKMDMNNYFLSLCSLIQDDYIVLDDECRDIIIQRLKNDKISIDIDNLISRIRIGNGTLNFFSEHKCLKFITSILKLTKSDFKDSPVVFERLKYLKKIGTRESDFEKAKDILDIKEDEFYLLSLKIAASVYADGSALVKTNNYLIEKLENSLNPNNDWYCCLPGFKLRVSGGVSSGKIKLNKIDFSNVEPKYFDSLIIAQSAYSSGIIYSDIEEVCNSDNFINYMQSKKDSLTNSEKSLIINIISNSKDRNVIEKFYDIVKDNENITDRDICIFCKAKLVSSEYILDNVFKFKDDKYSVEYSSGDILRACVKHNLTDVLIKIIEKFVENKVSLGAYTEGALQNVSSYLEKMIYLDDVEISDRKYLITILNDFNFLYLSYEYSNFLIKHLEYELFREALEIDETELKNIANYLLHKSYTPNTQRTKLKQMILSEEDIFKEKLKDGATMYISKYISSYGEYKSDSLIELINNYEDKAVIINYIKELMIDDKLSCMTDLEFMGIIKLIVNTNLLEEEEVMGMIRNKLFVPAY